MLINKKYFLLLCIVCRGSAAETTLNRTTPEFFQQVARELPHHTQALMYGLCTVMLKRSFDHFQLKAAPHNGSQTTLVTIPQGTVFTSTHQDDLVLKEAFVTELTMPAVEKLFTINKRNPVLDIASMLAGFGSYHYTRSKFEEFQKSPATQDDLVYWTAEGAALVLGATVGMLGIKTFDILFNN